MKRRRWQGDVGGKEASATKKRRRGGVSEEGSGTWHWRGGIGEEEALARMRHADVMINNNVFTKNKLRRSYLLGIYRSPIVK